MRLNFDCIRDILVKCEDVITFDHALYYEKSKVSEIFPGYTHSEVIYHIRQMSESGLIKIGPFYDSYDSVYILDLTPEGHSFLGNIRTETVWHKIKKAGVKSLSVLIPLAKDFALAYYQGTLQ